MTSAIACPLCEADTTITKYGDFACAHCGLAGTRSTLAAIGRLRVQAAKRLRKSADVYHERTALVAALAWLALQAGYRAGLGRHHPDPDPTWDPQWGTVIYVELPTGQLTWHVHDHDVGLFQGLPAYDPGWDGHGSEHKLERLAALRDAPASRLRALAALLGVPNETPDHELYLAAVARLEALRARLNGKAAHHAP